jgi:hypothetical protein
VHGGLTIRDYEALYPDVSRRTLQRGIKVMVEKRLLFPKGATNKLYYRRSGGRLNCGKKRLARYQDAIPVGY